MPSAPAGSSRPERSDLCRPRAHLAHGLPQTEGMARLWWRAMFAADGALFVEVEVAWRTLLEPESLLLGCVA